MIWFVSKPSADGRWSLTRTGSSTEFPVFSTTIVTLEVVSVVSGDVSFTRETLGILQG